MPEWAHAKYVRLKGFVEVGVPLPLMGGHNICLGWSRPSCRQCRTSGAGTVEKGGRKKQKHEYGVVVHVSVIHPPALPEDMQKNSRE